MKKYSTVANFVNEKYGIDGFVYSHYYYCGKKRRTHIRQPDAAQIEFSRSRNNQ